MKDTKENSPINLVCSEKVYFSYLVYFLRSNIFLAIGFNKSFQKKKIFLFKSWNFNFPNLKIKNYF